MATDFRNEYRELNQNEADTVLAVKVQATAFSGLLENVTDPRSRALAQTKLEECVMWAVKGLTG